MHLIGAQHILGKRYKASKFNDNVGLRRITFEHLERRNNIVFNDLTDRFLHFSNIYYILRNAQLISFDKDVYEDTINNPKLIKNQEQLYIKNIFIIDLIKKVEIYNKQKEIHKKLQLMN